jgi:endonuclease/exonuclease/phosphatase family metal-dependent hydrolase
MARLTKRNKNIKKKSRRIHKNKRVTNKFNLKKYRGGNPDPIIVVSYNILDVDLESNFVPRTMDSESQIQLKNININGSQINNNLLITDKTKITNLYDLAGQLYSAGFHSGGLKLNSSGSKLSKVETRKLWGSSEPTEFVSKNGKITVNLKKLLTAEFINLLYTNQTKPIENLQDIFEKITKMNDSRKWSTRSKKILEKIQNSNADIICLQEYGNCKNKSMVDDSSIDLPPDIKTKIAGFKNNPNKRQFLDEIEIQNANAETRNNTLPYELIKLGYVYNFFGYNPDTSNGDDGVAIFYKQTKFNFIERVSIGMDAKIQEEYKNDNENGKKYTSIRRSGLLVLKQKDSTKYSIICTAHLQSDSNERLTNRVKTLELEAISNQLNESYNQYKNENKDENPTVIFCGDFNLKLDYLENGGLSLLNNKEFIVKYDSDSDKSNTEIRLLRVVPEPVDLEFTTYSSRNEYIDYFYSNITGSMDANSFYQKTGEMPNNEEPSDHIMLTAKF